MRGNQANTLIAVVLICGVVLGCKQMQRLAKPTVVKSGDGMFEITVPGGWQVNALKTEKTDMKAGNVFEEMYVMVINESKSDFTDETSLDDYTKIVKDAMTEKLTDPESRPAVEVNVNGYPARQYEMKGAASNVKIAYLVTTVETASHYHQIITWTLISRLDKNRPTLQKVTESFRATANR